MAGNLLEERIPPQAVDAEMAVLGSMLLDAEAADSIFEILKAEHFYRESHQKIFAVLQEMADKSQPLDLITLTEALRRKKILTQVGGEVYLAQLAEKVTTTAHARSFAEIVYKKAVVRQLIRTSTAMVQRCYKEEYDDPQLLIDEAADSIYRLSQQQTLSGFVSSKELAPVSLGMFEEASKHKNLLRGVPSGLKGLDQKTGGFRKSDLIIVGARPGTGKTALALNIAYHAAVNANTAVAVFSLEMSRWQLMQRMYSSAAMVEGQQLSSGFFDASKWVDLTRVKGFLEKAPIHIDDTSGLSITEVRMRSRRLATELKKQGKELGLIIIDYLQLLRGSGRFESRQQEVSEISRMLKDLARTLNVPVIALSQLSRNTEDKTRMGNRPQLSDLRESGSIEQDADVVVLIYRKWYNDKKNAKGDIPEDTAPVEQDQTTLIVAKQRNGPVGDVAARFLSKFSLFTDPAPQSMEDVQNAVPRQTELMEPPE